MTYFNKIMLGAIGVMAISALTSAANAADLSVNSNLHNSVTGKPVEGVSNSNAMTDRASVNASTGDDGNKTDEGKSSKGVRTGATVSGNTSVDSTGSAAMSDRTSLKNSNPQK